MTRRDRNKNNSHKGSGGGCLIAIKKSDYYSIIHRPEWQQRDYEDVWLTLKPTAGRPLNILCVYLPPYLPAKCFEIYIEIIADKISTLPDEDFLLMGDFNDSKFHCIEDDVTGKSLSLVNLLDIL